MMNGMYQVFEQSTDAVFGIDGEKRIRFWNSSCENLLGHTREDILNTACAGVLCSVGLHGNAICGHDCPFSQRASGRPAAGNIDMMVDHENGNSIMVNVGAYYTPAELQQNTDNVGVFFSLRHISTRQLLQRMANTKNTDTHPDTCFSRLTPREKQLLNMASEGVKTAQIAKQLFISAETVRNHFKNMFLKLGVHSRTEAVGLALRHDII
ncbi:MAG: LuxR C-terminal-related transcriptional regulator [Pseudomonadota bacterium]